MQVIREREFSAEERRRLAVEGKALPDGSFPIANREDLVNAIRLVGRASNRAAARRHIVKRARALGLMALLPEEWGVGEGEGSEVSEVKAEYAIRIQEAGSLASGAGRDFRVALIREGLARSGRYFTRRAVEQVAAAADGLRAFANHPTADEDRSRPVRSVRDLVGFYTSLATTEGEGRLQAEATLHLFEGAEWLAGMAREALAAGRPEVIGLSIDSLAVVKAGEPAGVGRRVPVVEGIHELKSVDVVTRPSAGGAFLSVQEAEMVEAGTAVVDRVDAVDGAPASGASGAGDGSGAAAALEQAKALLAQVREAQLELACQRALDERLAAASSLPAPVQAKLRRLWLPSAALYRTQEAYGQALDAAVALEAESLELLRPLLAPAPERLLVTGHGAVRVMVAEADKQRLIAQLAMDRLFQVAESDEDPDWLRAGELGLRPSVPRWLGLREAYVQLTGDPMVSGSVNPEASIIREANEVTTGVLNQVVLNSMTKRLVKDYAGQPMWWRGVVSVVPVRDFKTQDRIKLHDFAALSTVAENGTYTNLAWDDVRETYAATKRGNLVVVTRETILNDDLSAVRRIPSKLARAAAITLNEFISNRITTNPAMQDGVNVFDATHNNTGVLSLSHANLKTTLVLFLNQVDTASKRMGIGPRFLLVPHDLLFTALEIVNSTLVPGSANNDRNVLQGVVEVRGVPQFTDVNDWFLMADPQDVETIEIGFVGGREAPELLMQDAPDAGSVFTNDAISFKVRHEYGGGWVDFRGAQRNVVA